MGDRRKEGVLYLVHFGNNGDEEARIEIPFVDKALDQRDELCAGSAVFSEDGEDPQGQGLGTRRERPEQSEQLAM